MRAARREHAHVLEVAAQPSSVALEMIEQVGRRLLPGVVGVAVATMRQHPEVVAASQQERRLDRVVREDVAAQRRPAREQGQAAAGGEGRDADDRVVAP